MIRRTAIPAWEQFSPQMEVWGPQKIGVFRGKRITKILGPKLAPKFWQWMDGQTMLLLNDGETGVFPSDLFRFLNHGLDKAPLVD